MEGKQSIQLREIVFPLLLASMPLLLGCAEKAGKDPYALWDAYEHRKHLYHFQYLSPPWVFVEDREEENRQLIAIDPRIERINYRMERDWKVLKATWKKPSVYSKQK